MGVMASQITSNYTVCSTTSSGQKNDKKKNNLSVYDLISSYCAAYIYASVNRVSVVSDSGLSPIRRQAINLTNSELLQIGPLGTKLCKLLIGTQTFPFKKIHLKTSSVKWRPFCLGPNVLRDNNV